MNGLAKPAKGQVDPSEPVVRQADLRHQVRSRPPPRSWSRRRATPPQKPLKTTFVIAQGGTGQMLSLPMNEFIQQSFKEIGIDVEFKVVELETLYTHWRKGAKDEMNARHHLEQHRLCHVRSALRHRALLPLGPGRAGRRELGLLQQSQGRRA